MEAPPGITVEPEGEEKEDGRRTDDLAARVQKLEEQVSGMHRKMWEAMGFAEATTEEAIDAFQRPETGYPPNPEPIKQLGAWEVKHASRI